MSAIGDQIAGSLADLRKATGLVSATYGRDGYTATLTNVGQGRTLFENMTELGIERYETKDFLIQSDQMNLRKTGFTTITKATPEIGDTVTVTIGNQSLVYQVLQPHAGSCWTYSDPDRTQIRAHTKLVGS